MTWKFIPDYKIRHIWADPDGSNEVAVSPDYYAVLGIPICTDGGDFQGSDKVYVRTEVLTN